MEIAITYYFGTILNLLDKFHGITISKRTQFLRFLGKNSID